MPVIECNKLITVPLWVANRWCALQYPGHPKGCPNYPKCRHSQRKKLTAAEVFDLEKPMYICYATFDLADHARRMKIRHPNWSERQCRNLLYWQRRVDKRVVRLASDFIKKEDLRGYYWLSEGFGVNVYATCRNAGLKLEQIRHISIVRKLVILAKWRKNAIRRN